MDLIPKNWERFQHYRNRNPPWIKFHRSLINDREFMRLPVASRALAPMLWLLASEHNLGIFDGSVDNLVFRLHLDQSEIIAGLKPLILNGLLLDASTMLAPCLQDAIPEGEGEGEREGEYICAPLQKFQHNGETEQKTTEQKNNSTAKALHKKNTAKKSPAKKQSTKKIKKTGTRIPDDWAPDFEAAKKINPDWSDEKIKREGEKFVDHWISTPGAKGIKLNWSATWRNWCRSPFNREKKINQQTRSEKNLIAINEWLENKND